MLPILRRHLPRLGSILAPLAMIAGALAFMISPANAVDFTAPGEALEAAPMQAVSQAAGVQPMELDRGAPVDNMPACAKVEGEKDPMKCLPIIRWATAMQMSDTVAFNVTQPMRSIEINTVEKTSYTGILSVGNVVWLIAALVVNAVTSYQVNAQMVQPLNNFAATFGASIVDSGAIYIILVIAVTMMAFAGVRNGFTLRRFTMMFLSLGVFCAMVMGSMNDRGEGSNYEPGFFSPAWMVQEVSGGFSAVSDALAIPFSNRSSENSTVFSAEAQEDPTSCKSYIDTLHSQYSQYYEDTGQTAPAALDVMSRWWEETAYRAFAEIQYGDKSNLGADYAACQQLETNAGIDNHSRHAILDQAYNSTDADYSAAVPVAGSPMITGGDTNENRAARQNLAWGLCQVDSEGNYTLRSDLPEEGIEGGKIGGPLTPEACAQIFTGDGVKHQPAFVFALPFSDKVSPDSTVKELREIQFAVVGDKSLLADPANGLADHKQSYNYVANSAGTVRTVSTMTAIAYMISAICGGIAMALMAGVLFLMKLLACAMAFFLIIAALAGVISQGFGSAATFFKGWLGYTAITSMTTLLFAFVMLMASGLVSMGDGVFGQWALAMMIWIGLCPALAIIMLNWAFKRLFRTKSPFTLRGMQAMAGNPYAVAGAAAGGGALLKGAMDNGRHKLTGAAWNAAKGRISGGKLGADSKSAAAGEELLGDAENPVPAGSQGAVDSSSTSDAVTSGKGAGVGGQVEGSTPTEASVEGDAGATAGVEGSENAGDVPLDIDADDSMVADSISGPGAGADGSQMTFGQRLEAFEADGMTDPRLEGAADQITGTAATIGTGARGLGRSGRLAMHRAGEVPSNLRQQIAGGAGLLKDRWAAGKATRSAIWKDPGLVAQYLGARGVGAASQVVGTAGTKLADAAKNPTTYKTAMKGAALYGGLALASGGLAVPAAVVGGRALLKHRQSLGQGAAGAAKSGAGALTGVAKSAYRAGVPEMAVADRQEAMESMELESRIRRDQSEDTGAPITELAHGLPVVQERQLSAEMSDATASYDAFEAENGRAPEAHERSAMVDDLPFYASMNEDAELRNLFESRVAEETVQAQQIFDQHQLEHGEQMGHARMREATRSLPFYSQSVRGLDLRQGSLPLVGTGNDSAPRLDAGDGPRSFDPFTAAEPVSVPVGQGAFDLEERSDQR